MLGNIQPNASLVILASTHVLRHVQWWNLDLVWPEIGLNYPPKEELVSDSTDMVLAKDHLAHKSGNLEKKMVEKLGF